MAFDNTMHTIPRIDYKKIVDASAYYFGKGYIEAQVPWIISYEASSLGKPPYRKNYETLGGFLNASGEQSFLQMMKEGVSLGKNFCITPCFRDEEILDDIHYKYFLKLELINTEVTKENLMEMIQDAKEFFENYIAVNVVQTDAHGLAFDIVDAQHDIELGSYGFRNYDGREWIYGTGIALPRFDVLVDK